jgi:hypothetical protein
MFSSSREYLQAATGTLMTRVDWGFIWRTPKTDMMNFFLTTLVPNSMVRRGR